jgi:hypothetical protein
MFEASRGNPENGPQDWQEASPEPSHTAGKDRTEQTTSWKTCSSVRPIFKYYFTDWADSNATLGPTHLQTYGQQEGTASSSPCCVED